MQNIQNFACGLWILCFLGLSFFIIGVLPPKNALLSWQSFLLGAAAAGSIYVVGTDPCFLQSLRDSVAMLTFQNKRLATSNVKLERQLKELSDVDEKFRAVHQQLESDAESALELLRDLEHHSRVQAVVSSLSLFLHADMDRSGFLQPEEAEHFLLGFTQLWDLVPDYPEDAVENMQGDLTFKMFSNLLRAVVQEDAPKCRRILDSMCNVEPDFIVSALPEPAPHPCCEVPQDSRKTDLESGSEDSTEEDYAMKPWLTIGPLKIWGRLHLLAILLLLLAVFCFCWDVLSLNFFASTIAILLLILGGGLALQGQLLVIAKRLRKEVGIYKEENTKLSNAVEELTGEVTRLRSIQKGLENLHNKFGGNAKRAQQLAKKESSHSKTHLVSVTLELFSRADEDGSGRLEGQELAEFRGTFEGICANIPGANMNAIHQMLSTDGLTLKQVHKLVADVLQRSA
ncbi:unnamed protein product [Symbiodinium natans]|uniref:EF-hand domain-containing protein n=1 Tax=Symbiodinium natans TaxID=878477 RepID=A0A812Q217_9DINO|nr:unnamed protein product [Symbiodinium natans]